MIEVTEKPIPTDNIYEKISHDGSGSVLIHIGVVKPVVNDKNTKGLRLAPDGDLAGELQEVEAAIREKWSVTDVYLCRRTGELGVGEVILVAAVSAPTRDTAFGACRDAVEFLKEERGLLKEELYEG